jgi:NAD(P)-dependent dehydrogenase (short-subunit alcohol dehydrogenase family)
VTQFEEWLPGEIVTAALSLASPASSFTSGSLIRVDGGMHRTLS